MAVIPVNFSQVNLQFSGTAAPTGAEVTFGVDNSTGLTPAAIESAVYVNWNTNLRPLTQSLLTLATILVKNGPNSTGPFVQVSHGTVGGSVSPCCSPQVAYLIRKATILGGRAQ